MGSLFVSHSSQDRAEVARLCDWLAGQGFRSLFLDFDPERGITAGTKWEAELYAQLRRADAVLFVGTPAAVASQWCFAELAMARSLGKTIVPVVITAGGAHPLLEDTQAVDLTGADTRGSERLRRRLVASELDPKRMFDWHPMRSPFPGLESFQEGDAAMFFGREAETDVLLAQMRSSRRRYTGRLLAVVGPSGSGKSSLARAGLLPRLRRAQPPWVVLEVLRPADRPVRQLAFVLVDAFADAGAPRSVESVELALSEGAAGLVGLAEELSEKRADASRPPVLVFVDQAEELVTPGGEEHEQFLALLSGATRGAGSVWSLLTLRSEFLSVFLQAQRGEFGFDDQLLIGPLDRARLAEVIERPAERSGVSFAPGLVGRMVADTGGGDALPLLAHTLAALYDRVRARAGATITIADYEDLGGVIGALRRSADDEQRRLVERGLGDLVVPTLNRLVSVGPEGQPTRRRLARAALSREEDEVVGAFVDARLLTSTELDGQSVVEVAHEALMRQWPPLTQAIDRDREWLQLRSEIERAAEDWERSRHHDEYLLPRERLAIAGRVSSSTLAAATDLTDIAQAFLAASQDRQRLQDEVRRRRTRRSFAGLAGALIVVSALALVALVQGRRAGDQRDTAQSTLLATNAIGELGTDPGESLVLARRAYAKRPTSLAEGALRVAAGRATPQLILRTGQDFDFRSVFASEGRHLALLGDDGRVRVWDVRAPRTPPTVLDAAEGIVTGMAFSAGGRRLAVSSTDGLRIWDRRSPRTPPIVVGDHVDMNGVAFARDGRHLATAGDDWTVRVWDRRAPGARPTVLDGHRGVVRAVAFAADGRHLASAGDDRTVRVWDWRARRPRPTVLRGRGYLSALAFASDGRHLTAAQQDGTVRVWDRRAPRARPIVLRGRQGISSVAADLSPVAIAPHGRHVASAGEDGTMRVWDWGAPSAEPVVLLGHQRFVFGMAFVDEGRHLVSASQDGTVRVWDWRVPRDQPTILRSHGRAGIAVAASGDGRYVAAGDGSGTVRVRDVRAPHAPPTVLKSRGGVAIDVVAFAADGRCLASGDRSRTVRVWDRHAPRAPRAVLRMRGGGATGRRTGPDEPPEFEVLAFAPDGHHLVTAGNIETVLVWNWRDPHAQPTDLGDPYRPSGTVNGLAFAHDGRHLAIGSVDRAVAIWDRRHPRAPRVHLRGHQGIVNAVAFDHNGRHLASTSDDGTVRVWDWRAPSAEPVVLRGHHGLVSAVTFGRDGRHLASTGEDGTVQVWDWRAPSVPPTVLRVGHGSVGDLAFAEDGRHLTAIDGDGKVWVWPCQRCGSIDDVLELARVRAPREVRR